MSFLNVKQNTHYYLKKELRSLACVLINACYGLIKEKDTLIEITAEAKVEKSNQSNKYFKLKEKVSPLTVENERLNKKLRDHTHNSPKTKEEGSSKLQFELEERLNKCKLDHDTSHKRNKMNRVKNELQKSSSWTTSSKLLTQLNNMDPNFSEGILIKTKKKKNIQLVIHTTLEISMCSILTIGYALSMVTTVTKRTLVMNNIIQQNKSSICQRRGDVEEPSQFSRKGHVPSGKKFYMPLWTKINLILYSQTPGDPN